MSSQKNCLLGQTNTWDIFGSYFIHLLHACFIYVWIFLWSALSLFKVAANKWGKKLKEWIIKKVTFSSTPNGFQVYKKSIIKKIAFLRTHNSPRETRLQSNPVSRQELNQPLSWVFIRLFSTTNQFRRILLFLHYCFVYE